jgi:hypothetical protein
MDLLCRSQPSRRPGIACLYTSISAERKLALAGAWRARLWDRSIKYENKSGDAKALNYLNIVHMNSDRS